MNLHLMPDEKIVTRVIQSFEEALPKSNKYVILRSKKLCRFVQTNNDNVCYSHVGTDEFWKFVGELSEYRYIVVHYLSFEAVDFLNKIEHDRIVWCIWGADLYNNILKHKGFQIYEDPLRELFSSLRYSFRETIKHKIQLLVYRPRIEKALKKISYVTSYCDYLLIKHYYPDGNLKYKHLFYYPIDSIVCDLPEADNLGEKIILGNSASYTNNHVGVLKKLSNIGTQREIVTPLSYGAAKKYVKKMGYKYCPKTFQPIMEFLPMDDYNKLLMSASTFIYPHFRQEAFGNIITALYIGGTVFLYRRNPLFQTLKNMGFLFFSIEELPQRINYKLSNTEKQENRKIAINEYGKQKQIETISREFC